MESNRRIETKYQNASAGKNQGLLDGVSFPLSCSKTQLKLKTSWPSTKGQISMVQKKVVAT
ncbi:hypothetical protein R6Q59_031902 [Mikania micrantha]